MPIIDGPENIDTICEAETAEDFSDAEVTEGVCVVDMDECCTDLLKFAMNHNDRPEVEWQRFKTKLSSKNRRIQR